jgi:hypothetical protein
MGKWNQIVEEVQRGSMERAMKFYLRLFEWLDRLGKRVPKYHGGADLVLPPRDLKADELQSLLEHYKR